MKVVLEFLEELEDSAKYFFYTNLIFWRVILGGWEGFKAGLLVAIGIHLFWDGAIAIPKAVTKG